VCGLFGQSNDNQVIDSQVVNLTIKEYSEAFGVSDTTTRTKVREKRVKAYKQNNKWLIKVNKCEIPDPVDNINSQLISGSDTLTNVVNQLNSQLDYFKERVAVLELEMNEQKKRHDTILLKMTDQNQLLLQQSSKKPFWKIW
tara:strand:+ start:116 stop:541 length:426 start_codon:yes stop_codon:yes gene_type:complete